MGWERASENGGLSLGPRCKNPLRQLQARARQEPVKKTRTKGR